MKKAQREVTMEQVIRVLRKYDSFCSWPIGELEYVAGIFHMRPEEMRASVRDARAEMLRLDSVTTGVFP